MVVAAGIDDGGVRAMLGCGAGAQADVRDADPDHPLPAA
jgi:hypothetical protein